MKPKIIGLTGGIGSGKTTVARLFEKKGIPVYIADDEAKKLMQSPDVSAEVADAFGPEVVTAAGFPDRAKLAAIVFKDPQKLKILNGIIHPRVSAHFSTWAEAHARHPFVIKEAAILFESGSYVQCEKIIVVTAPMDVRLSRVVQRDKVAPEAVLQRMENQWTDEKKVGMSDFIIHNYDLQDTEKQVDELIKVLLNV